MESKRKPRRIEMGGGIKKMKTWEEMTKLDKRNKMMIAFYIFMAIFEIGAAIFEKEFILTIFALLWINIAVMEYCNAKMLKGKEAIIKLQEEHIDIQDDMIMDLLKDLSMPYVVIETDLIKIPENFTKPNKNKLKNRIEYYNKNKCFKVPIIIDPSNMLLDGYTSYLIAKQYNLKTVQAKVKIGE